MSKAQDLIVNKSQSTGYVCHLFPYDKLSSQVMSASGLLITFMSFALMGNAACDTFCQICSCDINTIVCRRVDTISNISAFDVLSPNNINSM